MSNGSAAGSLTIWIRIAFVRVKYTHSESQKIPTNVFKKKNTPLKNDPRAQQYTDSTEDLVTAGTNQPLRPTLFTNCIFFGARHLY